MLKEADWEPHLHWKSLSTEFAEDSPHYTLCPDGKTTLNVSNNNFHWETNWDQAQQKLISFMLCKICSMCKEITILIDY